MKNEPLKKNNTTHPEERSLEARRIGGVIQKEHRCGVIEFEVLDVP